MRSRRADGAGSLPLARVRSSCSLVGGAPGHRAHMRSDEAGRRHRADGRRAGGTRSSSAAHQCSQGVVGYSHPLGAFPLVQDTRGSRELTRAPATGLFSVTPAV